MPPLLAARSLQRADARADGRYGDEAAKKTRWHGRKQRRISRAGEKRKRVHAARDTLLFDRASGSCGGAADDAAEGVKPQALYSYYS